MTERQNQTAPVDFDLFQDRLTDAFRESENGLGAVAMARKMTHRYFMDRGRGGIISFDSQPTFEEKLPFSNLPENIQDEVLGLVKGEPISSESADYLREHFAEGRALVRCILGAYREAAS